ncbi:chromatin assembly factor 1 subunit A-like [Eurosta solidaginis]|uniref:chromatin assembly factor 1 subunit A-like n=1 Tax=Eurosta solidaginis TaxID=178769 RepID=UPI003530D435
MELEQNNKVKSKRIRCNPTRRWTVADEKCLIEFLLENRLLEKPSAQVYYKRFCEEKNVTMEWKLVRAKVRNMRSGYNKANAWEGSTGGGSMTGDTIEGTLLKMCTFFYELDDIFGSRISESSVIDDTMANLNEEGQIIEVTEEGQKIETESQMPVQITESYHNPVCSSKMTPTTSSQSPTAASDIMKGQAEAMAFKKQKLEAETIAREKELVIRENEFTLKQKEFELKERQARYEENFKEKQLQSQEKLKILELEMQERLAMEELKLKFK